MNNDHCTITLRKRPWWTWLQAAVWLLAEAVLLQTAVASARESEYRALAMSAVIAVLVGIGGLLFWLRQGRRLGRHTSA